MAARISKEQIKQMVELYAQLGTYSGVAKQLGISAATVSRYIKEAQTAVSQITPCAAEPLPVESISLETIKSFAELTPEEEISYEAWRKEFGR